MSELIAIVGPTPGPGHGECFIWTRDSSTKAVAVDAGGSKSTGQHAGARAPEILILSHDDSDHIRGAVALINTAGTSLRELWIPVEWAILIKQIADTDRDALLPDSTEPVSVGSLATSIAVQITEAVFNAEANPLSAGLLALAARNLSSWDNTPFEPAQGFSLAEPSRKEEQWYGATGLSEIIRRVRYRAKALIDILTAAHINSVRIRFFSIDLALSSTSKTWETEGKPGTATLANASEAPYPLAVRIPSGLPYAYALTRLTVQNRRALCTLLWSDPSTPKGGTVIWSDTDGNWLDHSSPLGLDRVISTLRASSAPHHASANVAHDRVWAELGRAPSTLLMVSAGGNRNQSYRTEFNALRGRRCCTWCRPASTNYQEVRASSVAGGGMSLHTTCIGIH